VYYTADIDITTFSATVSVRAINSDAVVVAGVEDGVDCHVTNSIIILEPE